MLKHKTRLLAGFLLILFVACSNAPATAPPLPTAADPTAVPRPTVVVPTLLPSTNEPPAAATENPAPNDAVLPDDAVWVFVDNAVIAATDALPHPQVILGDDPMMLNAMAIQAAPDGSRFVYSLADAMGQNRFFVVDAQTGGQTVLNDIPNVHIVGARFSPDGQQLAFTRIDQSKMPYAWQLETMGAQASDSRVLTQYVLQGPADHLKPLSPFGWAANGIFVEQLLWNADALPHGIARVNPQDGSTQALNDEDHIRAEISADGTRAAVLTGILPMGPDVDWKVSLTTLDLETGAATPLITDGKFWVQGVRWAPDAKHLLYLKQANLGLPFNELVVTTPDGTGEQTLLMGENGVPRILHDAAWSGNNTLLLLISDATNQLRLYEATVDALNADALREVAVFEGGQLPNVPPRILYVPG